MLRRADGSPCGGASGGGAPGGGHHSAQAANGAARVHGDPGIVKVTPGCASTLGGGNSARAGLVALALVGLRRRRRA